MQVIYLIRHGETVFNRDGRVQGHTESDLSELGREQARRVGDRIRGVEFDAVFTSPLRRAEETCSIDVPSGATQVWVRVHGYRAGTYDLVVTHSPPGT